MIRSAPLILLSIMAVAGAAAVVSALVPATPSLARTIRRLRREVAPVPQPTYARLLMGVREWPWVRRVLPSSPDLAVAGVTTEQYVLQLIAASCAGTLLAVGTAVFLAVAGVLPLPTPVVLLAGLVGFVGAPAALHAVRLDHIRAERDDMRHQLSAYLDVVTMLLAANEGQEGALEHAASAGDGRLFRELRRRIREVGAAGGSHVNALATTGAEFGLPELEQVAATAALSSAEGSPVARTLAAKCATLRSTLASEQETEARLRTSRLTMPIVGMALIFMSLVIYPALAAT